MGLLDDLKKKVADKEAQDARPPAESARANEFRAVALPAMFRIHQNLTELVQQLKVLQEEAPATIKIPGIGEASGFLQGNYEVSSEGMPPEAVTLRCSLRQQRERPMEITTAGVDNTIWLDRLRMQGLQARILRSRDGTGTSRKTYIGIQGNIPVSLHFTLDFDNAALQLLSRNYDELTDRKQIFNPANVTEQWCDELLKYVVRAENTFMRYEVPPDMREQLRQRVDWERRKGRGVPQTAERAFGLGAMLKIAVRRAPEVPEPPEPSAASGNLPEEGAETVEVIYESAENRLASSPTIRNLLKRRPPLKLRYRNQTIDLALHDGAFVIGRAADCHLHVNEEHVSKVHARIELMDDEYHLTDESRNGTWLSFFDGRRERLHRSTIRLEGEGCFALGTRVSPRNAHMIDFVA